ncbi:MAG: acyl-CoA dehydratase activase [Pseudomonadota bacterium]
MGAKLYAGVDVGAATAKTVIFSDGKILGFKVIPTGHSISLAAAEATRLALEDAGIEVNGDQFNEIFDYVISTGYGRNGVVFSSKAITEIMCHARGAYFLLPKTRTIIDIGGQDSKAIGLDEDGNVSNFVMNDKCAAGTGRFLEVMAEVLGVKLEKLGEEALTSKNPCTVSTTCTIFAESEMVSLRAEGRKREDLVAGIVRSVASRVSIMGRTVGFEDDVVFTGGVAKNIGVKAALEHEIGKNIIVNDEPQIMGALGSCYICRRNETLNRFSL